ncbi:hypothetical protein Hanom_Chr00s088077g01797511 [Helianthus anomalus]
MIPHKVLRSGAVCPVMAPAWRRTHQNEGRHEGERREGRDLHSGVS